MKLLHTSDLHLGIRIYERSMLEEQKAILDQIVEIARREHTDVTIIAGDVYDRAVGSDEAISLFDDFLVSLKEANQKVIVVSGNHDSAERIAFGSKIMNAGGVYLSSVYDGHLNPVLLDDAYGPVNFYLIPFLKPANVQPYFIDRELDDNTKALQAVLEECAPDYSQRNVAIAHQFITNAQCAGSERKTIGGLNDVNADVFAQFDYVALGHLHGEQCCGHEHIRYSGTPLKYSFAEVNHTKSVTIVELNEKGNMAMHFVSLSPQHEWRDLRGSFDELTAESYYKSSTLSDDYVRITLTDEDDVPDAIGLLRAIYHNLLELQYDNTRTRLDSADIAMGPSTVDKTPDVFISELFEAQNGRPMSERQTNYINEIIKKIWGE